MAFEERVPRPCLCREHMLERHPADSDCNGRIAPCNATLRIRIG